MNSRHIGTVQQLSIDAIYLFIFSIVSYPVIRKKVVDELVQSQRENIHIYFSKRVGNIHGGRATN